MTIENLAAWQRRTGERLSIGPAELPPVAEGQILIRNEAVAINPLDYILQDMAALPWLDYPLIVGSDVAGTIVAIGKGVDRFALGDRVLGQAVGTTVNQPSQGAFQQHTIVLAQMAAPRGVNTSTSVISLRPKPVHPKRCRPMQVTSISNNCAAIPKRFARASNITVLSTSRSRNINAGRRQARSPFRCLLSRGRSPAATWSPTS